MEHLKHASSRAAAWAWYQRGAGSGAMLATARSEGALHSTASGYQRSLLTRGGSSPSRFKLEADLLFLSSPSMEDTSDRLQSLHLSSRSDVNCASSDNILAPPTTSQMNSTAFTPLTDEEGLLVVMSGSSYGTASWDCGSSLFDSFELVAMSKKLDAAHQLDEGTIERVCAQVDVSKGYECDEFGINKEEEEEVEAEAKEDSSIGLKALRLTVGINTDMDSKSALNDCKQSRQAIYDMFCRVENVLAPIEPPNDNYEHVKKSPSTSPLAPRSSKQYRRRRLDSLSKAFRHHFVQLTRQSGRQSRIPIDSQHAPDTVQNLLQSTSLPARASPNLHTHDGKTARGLESPSWGVRRTKAEFAGRRFEGSKHSLKKLHSSNDVNHYHHHHYHHHHHHHYLFQQHSSDNLGLQLPVAPLLADKSHQVAAAGLRGSKVSSLHNPGSASPDSKRKWGDTNSHVAAYYSMESYGFPVPQER